MSVYQPEFDAMQEALEDHGRRSGEYETAQDRYQACLIHEGNMAAARQSHGAAWDEKLYQLQRDIQAAWDKLFYGLEVPPRPTCGRNSIGVRSKILGNKKSAMIFSEKSLCCCQLFCGCLCLLRRPEDNWLS